VIAKEKGGGVMPFVVIKGTWI